MKVLKEETILDNDELIHWLKQKTNQLERKMDVRDYDKEIRDYDIFKKEYITDTIENHLKRYREYLADLHDKQAIKNEHLDTSLLESSFNPLTELEKHYGKANVEKISNNRYIVTLPDNHTMLIKYDVDISLGSDRNYPNQIPEGAVWVNDHFELDGNTLPGPYFYSRKMPRNKRTIIDKGTNYQVIGRFDNTNK